MKTLLFVLMPIFLFAQSITYQDTITVLNQKSYPCYVMSINENKVSFLYLTNREESTVINGIENLVINPFGKVYSNEIGFLQNIDTLTSFLEKRNTITFPPPPVVETINKISSNNETVFEPSKIITSEVSDNSAEYPWSFGITYVPYYTGTIYSAEFYNYSNFINIYSNSNNQYMMIGQFSYLVYDKIRITFDASYTGTATEKNDNYHYTSNSDTSFSKIKVVDIKNLFSINVGVKYYFKHLFNNKVSPYLAFNIGKQFASITDETKEVYSSQLTKPIYENNIEEFLKDINSPFFASIVFGVEYSFNESLSLISNMQISYSTANANYKSRKLQNSYQETNMGDFNVSYFTTKFGVGLNFYF